MKLRIGTRGSRLALAQANEAAAGFARLGYAAEIVTVHTRGDADAVSPLSEIGRGAFTDIFSELLARGEIDVAVHSAKDLPTESGRDGFFCLPRADARDALLCMDRAILRVGTGSPRREAAVRTLYPAATVLPVRGNVDTRIRKLLSGEYDALVLAMAGLERLGFSDTRIRVLPLSVQDCVPAACQGIIALEGEAGSLLHDADTGRAARIERACQRALGGDCTGGVGCYFDGRRLYVQKDGRIASALYEGEGTFSTLREALQ